MLRADMSNVNWTFGISIVVFTAIEGILIAFLLFFSGDAHPQEFKDDESGPCKYGYGIVLDKANQS